MNIKFHNYLSCSWLLENQPGRWDSIIILDSGLRESSFVEEHSNRHLYLRFDDVTKAVAGKREPALADIEEALGFAKGSENLVVSCRAGQSRSAALAFSIAYHFADATHALSLWNPKRHSPNRLVLELAANKFEDPLFERAYEEWFTRNRCISLTDYLDEIEEEYDELEAQGATNRILG